MKKEWFEPGPDGVSPFVREYRKVPGPWASTSISDAFRALIAQDAAKEPPALAVGDVVRLERYESGRDGYEFFKSEAHLVGTEHTISKIYENVGVKVANTYWPLSALTLVRRAGEPALVDKCSKDAEIERLTSSLNALTASYDEIIALNDARNDEIARLTHELHARNDEIVGLRAEVERLKSEKHACNCSVQLEEMKMHYAAATARADALQARFDAGVRVYRCKNSVWWGAHFDDYGDTALLIDARPIAGEMASATTPSFDGTPTDSTHGTTLDPIAAADERKVDANRCDCSSDGLCHFSHGQCFYDANGTLQDNRRRTAGTRADRKGN